ncbi:nuclease-related domain-containing protein [Pseudomarimonas salicorniae]|uniref:NERD domain-containing protein n=1 Tax=Pseudomarimonas salicorniae TaxID=2933270 RepID=A0ABT0GEZ1_9GAMM|nr:nuclease-related domain-containing protein [Lysobacter sp. CAU 1642]MCK7592922.1 NERD domain-containing protein [Lysobacter sp. CAU 1642]
MFLPMLSAAGFALLWMRVIGRDRRRSPLNVQPFHFPGESLRARLDDLSEKFNEATLIIVVTGPVTIGAWLALRTQDSGWAQTELRLLDLIIWLCAFAFLCWHVVKLFRTGRTMRQYREGLAAELAVAQYLQVLPEQGYRVLHDIPGQGFNIDHVVIGRSAVFAIETKSRKKPHAKGKASAQVEFNGARLAFPDHVETKPLDQARGNARWLEDLLRRELGAPIRVVPVLALPGWYVNLTREGAMSDVLVNNCKVPNFVKQDRFGPPLTAGQASGVRAALLRRYEIAAAEAAGRKAAIGGEQHVA